MAATTSDAVDTFFCCEATTRPTAMAAQRNGGRGGATEEARRPRAGGGPSFRRRSRAERSWVRLGRRRSTSGHVRVGASPAAAGGRMLVVGRICNAGRAPAGGGGGGGPPPPGGGPARGRPS